MDAINVNGEVIDHIELIKMNKQLYQDFQPGAISGVSTDLILLHQGLKRSRVEVTQVPEKDKSFKVHCRFSAPRVQKPRKVRLKLHSESGKYELGSEQEVILPPVEGEMMEVELTAIPRVDVKVNQEKMKLMLEPEPMAPAP